MRLDRIYLARKHEKKIFNRIVKTPVIPTDHKLVLVKFAPKDAPSVGKGRWTCPCKAVNDENLINKIVNKGILIQDKIETLLNTPPLSKGLKAHK